LIPKARFRLRLGLALVAVFCLAIPDSGYAIGTANNGRGNWRVRYCGNPLVDHDKFGPMIEGASWELSTGRDFSSKQSKWLLGYVENRVRRHTKLMDETNSPEKLLANLRQPLIEMLQNAMEWGNEFKNHLVVRTEVRVHQSALVVEIEDEGPGFDRNNLQHAATEDDPFSHLEVRQEMGKREGGFGLMLTRGFTHELEHSDRGNRVTLVWYWSRIHQLPNNAR
jgi:anti-sigma regulatory factor (Ser/Thr protein kinase)